jgi:hypothetical protein
MTYMGDTEKQAILRDEAIKKSMKAKRNMYISSARALIKCVKKKRGLESYGVYMYQKFDAISTRSKMSILPSPFKSYVVLDWSKKAATAGRREGSQTP